MDEGLSQAVALLEAQLKKQERAALDTKRAVNAIYMAAGESPRYSDSDLGESTGPSLAIRSDQFYGQPLAASIREVLEMRRALKQGPATVNELYEALLQGGFKFDTKNEDNSKRGLRISLTKNTVTFHKLPNGKFGLLEWYPNAKSAKPKVNGEPEGDDDAGSIDAPEEDKS